MKNVGRYKVISRLGSGASGQLFHALDPLIGRHVAIKLLRRTSDPATQDRLRREAEVLGGLAHNNIVRLFEFGVEDDIPYIVLEFLEGRDLGSAMRARAVGPLWRRLDLMTQVASALEYAHGAGVIHGDVSPANIYVLPDGTARLVDFGLARNADRSGTDQQGMMTGTPLYFSPEQCAGQIPDIASDLFSWGVVLYELATDTHPFAHEDVNVLICRISMNVHRPLAEINPALPADLSVIVDRCLRKEPSERYHSLAEVVSDLSAVVSRLKVRRSTELVELARTWNLEQRREQAREALAQALVLDPSNQDARLLRDKITSLA